MASMDTLFAVGFNPQVYIIAILSPRVLYLLIYYIISLP